MLNTQHYKVRIKGKGVAPSSTSWCSSYRKGSLRVTLDYGWQQLLYRLISLVGRVFDNGSQDLGSIPGRVIPKTFKMVLDTDLLITKHYKVRNKGKVQQSREWFSALPYISV